MTVNQFYYISLSSNRSGQTNVTLHNFHLNFFNYEKRDIEITKFHIFSTKSATRYSYFEFATILKKKKLQTLTFYNIINLKFMII